MNVPMFVWLLVSAAICKYHVIFVVNIGTCIGYTPSNSERSLVNKIHGPVKSNTNTHKIDLYIFGGKCPPRRKCPDKQLNGHVKFEVDHLKLSRKPTMHNDYPHLLYKRSLKTKNQEYIGNQAPQTEEGAPRTLVTNTSPTTSVTQSTATQSTATPVTDITTVTSDIEIPATHSTETTPATQVTKITTVTPVIEIKSPPVTEIAPATKYSEITPTRFNEITTATHFAGNTSVTPIKQIKENSTTTPAVSHYIYGEPLNPNPNPNPNLNLNPNPNTYPYINPNPNPNDVFNDGNTDVSNYNYTEDLNNLHSNYTFDHECSVNNWCSDIKETDTCSCNPRSCPLTGDCCRDTFPTTSILLKKHLEKSSRCQLFETSEQPIYISTVYTCSNPKLHQLASKCNDEMTPSDPFDVKRVLPVYSAATQLTYTNIYCAKCHNEDAGDMIPFTIVVIETTNEVAYDLPLEKLYYSDDCYIGFDPLDVLDNITQCPDGDIIDHCR